MANQSSFGAKKGAFLVLLDSTLLVKRFEFRVDDFANRSFRRIEDAYKLRMNVVVCSASSETKVLAVCTTVVDTINNTQNNECFSTHCALLQYACILGFATKNAAPCTDD